MNEPLISIVIPVYNVEMYLRECLDSILLQTYKNFEVILVDDNSTDSSFKICNEYALKDSRIKVFQHKEKSGGGGITRNTGLKHISGDYVTFIDSDDLIEKNYLEVLLSNAKKDNISCVYYRFYNIDKLNKQFNRKERVIKHKDILKVYFTDSTYMSPWSKLIPREFVSGFSFTNGLLEDAEAMYKVLIKANELVVSNKSNYLYRVRMGSNASPNDEKKYYVYAKRTFEVYDGLKELKVSKGVYRYFYGWQLEYLFLYFLRTTSSVETKKELKRISRLLRIHFFRYFFSNTDFRTRIKLILNFISPSLLRKISQKRQEQVLLNNERYF